MATKKIRVPLFGSYNQRKYGWLDANQDQRMINCMPVMVENPVTGRNTFYLEKRPGLAGPAGGSGGAIGGKLYFSIGLGAAIYGQKVGTTCHLVMAGTLISTVASDGNCISITETTLNGKNVLVFIILQGGVRQYWYWFEDAGTGTTTTFTGNLTGGSPTVTGIASTTGIYVGQLLAQANIPAGTRVQSVDSTTQITMTANATGGGGAAFSITRDVLGLIYDTDFPANTVGEPCFKDGYMFIMDSSGKIWNTDLNSLTAIGSASYTSTDAVPDGGTGCVLLGEYIIAFGTDSAEVFHNVGNVSGSPLGRVQGPVINIGRRGETDGGTSQLTTAKVYGNTLYWISPDRVAYAMTGREVEDISRYGVTRGALGSVRGYANLAGIEMVFFGNHATGTAAGTTFVYFPQSKAWTEFRKAGATSSDYFLEFCRKNPTTQSTDPYGIVAIDRTNSGTWSGGFAAGSATDYKDGSTILTQEIQLAINFPTNNRVLVHQLELIGDVRGTSGNTAITVSWDDGTTFSAARNIDMSTRNRKISRLGSGRQRMVLNITDAVNAPLRMEAVDITYEEAAN